MLGHFLRDYKGYRFVTIRATAMKLESCKHLDKCSSKLPSILSFDLYLRSLILQIFVEFLRLGHCLRDYMG